LQSYDAKNFVQFSFLDRPVACSAGRPGRLKSAKLTMGDYTVGAVVARISFLVWHPDRCQTRRLLVPNCFCHLYGCTDHFVVSYKLFLR